MARPPRDNAAPSAEFAAAVFESYGLSATGFWRSTGIPSDEAQPDAPAIGLCRALARLGGIYSTFARFLNYRADLLRGSYIAQLRSLELSAPAIPPSTVAALLERDFGPAAQEVVASLSVAPTWNTPSRCAYLSSYRGQPVVVEVAHPPAGEEALAEFEKSLRAIRHADLAPVVHPATLAEFREFLGDSASLERERSFLEVLGLHKGTTMTEYPVPIPELCSADVLCWPAVEGKPVAALIAAGDPKGAELIAAAILEQFFSLSMVEGDLDLAAMVVDFDGRLRFRRLSHPIAVLPGVIDSGIKYVASVIAGNAPRSAQNLIRLIMPRPPLDLEKDLMEEFSGVEPELKINMWFPPAAGTLESNWRALAKLVPARPLFLDCLHRNLLAAGYWNADAVGSGSAPRDAISEAMWPALSQVLRNQAGDLANRETFRDWAMGSGMLMFSTLREMNRSIEELRENDITVGVDLSARRGPQRNGRKPGIYPYLLAGLLVFFLVGLEWGSTAPEPWSLVLKILAVSALPAMFWAVSKIR